MTLSLRSKLVLFVVCLIFLSCAAVGINSYMISGEALGTNIKSDATRTAIDFANVVGMIFDTAKSDAEMLGGRSVSMDLLRSQNPDSKLTQDYQVFLNRFEALKPFYLSMGLINLDKKVVMSSQRNEVGEAFFAPSVLSSDVKFHISKAFAYGPNKTPSVVVSFTVSDVQNVHLGYAFVVVSLEKISEQFFQSIKIADTGFGLMVDKSTIVLHSHTEHILEASPAWDSFLNKLSSDSGSFVLFENGENYFYTYAKDPVTGWYTLTRCAEQDMYSAINNLAKISLLSALLSMFVASCISYIYLNAIIAGLNKAIDFAKRVANGELHTKIQINRKDEVGILANSVQAVQNTLDTVVSNYGSIEQAISLGRLRTFGSTQNLKGEYALLVQGTNNIITRFQSILDQFPDPMLVVDEEQKIVFMNKAAELLAGGDYTGSAYYEVYHFADSSDTNSPLQKSLISHKTEEGETRLQLAGHSLSISYSCTPMFSPQNKLTCCLIFIKDITKIRQTEQAILDVVNQATDISRRMVSASEQLNKNIGEVSSGAIVQNEQASTTAAAMVEMNSTVMEVAKNAEAASAQATATHSKAVNGADMVNSVVSAINHVNGVAVALQKNMKELGVQTENIGGVMDVISDIADQTNLLALNAAIEAARAGEAGRGFAVVADEVRKLAEQTMSATNQVGKNIQGIQLSAEHNIQQVELAAKNIDEATKLADSSGLALREILELVDQNSALIGTIAAAAEEQSASSDEINRAISAISQITEKTAKGMEASREAVRQVFNMSQELKDLLDRIKH